MSLCKKSNIPIFYYKKDKSIIDIIVFIIKFIFFFDTSCLFTNKKTQKGGSNDIEEDNIEDTEDPQDNFYMQPDAELYSDFDKDPPTMEDNKTDDDKLLEQSNYAIISKEIANGIKAGKNYVVAFLLVIVNFFFNASLYPSIPFFGILAFCYATLKWFLMKFKKF